ncbi:hypothetical protein [Streptomyces sp. NPDC002550]
MTLTTTGLFTIACIGLAVWIFRKNHHKKREVLAVSLFWILLVATPVGGDAVNKVQSMLGNGAQTASDTVNSVSSK